MTGKPHTEDQPLSCLECHEGLQEYLDGTLDKQRSLSFFLHLRDCTACRTEHDRLQSLFGLLDGLPDHPVPEDFDAAILAAVPYEAYREMEPIRRERVPVFLEKEALPTWLRSPVTRGVGLTVAAVAVTAGVALDAPGSLVAVPVIGVLPEAIVQIQALGRRLTLSMRRAEG